MSLSLFDNPVIHSALFHPRPARPGYSSLSTVRDGVIPVEDGVELGYRLYVHAPAAPVILYFHGNGEIASDHDMFAPRYRNAGASLLVVDYRGYGWSTGTPRVSALLSDAEIVVSAVPPIVQEAGLSDHALFVMGRSLGSASAIHAAYTYPERFRGMIIESGFSNAPRLLSNLGIPAGLVGAILPDPVGNEHKLSTLTQPLLVIHGERDTLLPIRNAEELIAASASVDKRFERIPGAGHNDLTFFGMAQYFGAIATFLTDYTPAEESDLPEEGEV
jgi:pimeloyl-ACP methyl ester carboxylesterase